MSEYRAPVKDMRFVINELAGLAEVAALPGFEEATPDLVEAVLGAVINCLANICIIVGPV